MNDIEEMLPAIAEPETMKRALEKPIAMTPQQARVDAVAALTTVAVSRAATLQLTPEETKSLVADFPDSDFQTGAGGKEALIYIQHAALRDRLNTVLGLGQWATIVRETWNEDFVSGKGTNGTRVYARAMLLVRGCYVAEAVGDMDYYPGNAAQNYGDAFEGSKTAAFRRCAKEFGVGLQAWRKEWCEGWWTRRRNGTKPAASPPQVMKPAVATPRARTPEERHDALFGKLKGLEPEATKVFLEEGLIFEGETFSDISVSRIELMKPDQMLALINTVKMRKADNDQVPGAEVSSSYVDEGGVADPVGVIEETNAKNGTTKGGKAFTKFGIKIDGVWHNTFSRTLFEVAMPLKGQRVRYTAKAGEYGSDLLTIESAEENTP